MSEARAAFAHRLNQAFDRLGIPAKQHGRFTALARLFGVSAVAARDWCEGKSYPSVDKLLVILDTARCGADWLLYGRASPAAPGGEASAAMSPVPGAPGGEAPAAAGPAGSTAADGAWMRVDGDSMAPALLPGDQVQLAPAGPAPWQDGIYLLQATGRPGAARLRRVQGRLDGSVEAACDNPLYAERGRYLPGPEGRLAGCESGMPEVQILGRVVELRRRLP